MHERVDDYLNARRRLGYKLRIEGEQLRRFAQFARAQGHEGILTVELAVAWANSSKSASDICRARRLEIVRSLAKYCALFEPETQVPAPRLLGPAHRRVAPHIYTAHEIGKVMEAAAEIKPRNGLRPATMRCLIGLLSATGLRISEALHLTCTDVDFEERQLVVRETKFRKSRYVPLHPSTVKALEAYTRFRDRRVPLRSPRGAFFLCDDGRPLRYRQALYAFQCIRRRVGWTQGKRPPRLHDLRHSFASNRILAWYKQGIDVNNAIFLLSVYLGHGKVTDTYWYLTGTPLLMSIAAKRFECFASKEEVRHG
jgi:integrase